MSAAAFPPVEQLVPHQPPMLLVSRVLRHSEQETLCAVDVAQGELFLDPARRAPGWLAIEYMAQATAVHGGLLARGLEQAPRPGLLLAVRGLRCRVGWFGCEQQLVVRARPLGAGSRLLSFDCRVEDPAEPEPLASAQLQVYVPERMEELLHGALRDTP